MTFSAGYLTDACLSGYDLRHDALSFVRLCKYGMRMVKIRISM